MTISGTGFGISAEDVQVGFGNYATVDSWSYTEISVSLPALPKGDYPVLVSVSDGFSDTR